MVTSLLDQLLGLTPDDLKLLKAISRIGAATADEVALKLQRPGADLTPWINQLVQRKLVETQKMTIGGEVFQVYQVDPLVQKSLQKLRDA